jgi:hypothetical protein
MSHRTKAEIKMRFGKGGVLADITIPAHTRCVHASHGQFFVDDLSWLDRNSMTLHDATYYGIRIDADQVEEV